jgi:Diacylglycerol kinase catalytic domain/Diacylglycerol kinase accessory domain
MNPTQLWRINPRSGNMAGQRLLERLRGQPEVAAEAIALNNLGEQLRSFDAASQIVVAGGDGTFAAVLASPSLDDTPVVCMPLGTANDLSRELGISRLVRGRAAEELPALFSSLEVRQLAVWELRSGERVVPFCNYASLGYEGAVVQDFAAWRSRTKWSNRWSNRLMYGAYGTRRMFSQLSGLTVSADGAPPQPCPSTTGLLVTNIRSHLGLGLSTRDGSPFDSRIECVVAPTAFTYTRMIAASLGVISAPQTFSSGETITIENIPHGTALQVDGEPARPLSSSVVTISLRRFARVGCALE